MSAPGRELPFVTVRVFSGSATKYAAANGRVRPEADIRGSFNCAQNLMNISMSVLAQHRQFGKNVRAIRADFDAFFHEFAQIIMVNPIHDAILIGLIDARPADYFEIVPNRDGFFQTIGGIDPAETGHRLKVAIFKIIAKSIEACPFSNPDRAQFSKLIAKWQYSALDYPH
jgi:hypothetical protein